MKSSAAVWIGWSMSAVVSGQLVVAFFIYMFAPHVAWPFADEIGISRDLGRYIGTMWLTCACLYVYPRTSVLGAILLTGAFGGTIALHLRIGGFQIGSIILGIMTWGGLWLRDPRLRSMLPFDYRGTQCRSRPLTE